MIATSNDTALKKLMEQKQSWKVGYHLCLGKGYEEIRDIINRSFNCSMETSEIRHFSNMLKKEIGVMTTAQILLHFKHNRYPPFTDAWY